MLSWLEGRKTKLFALLMVVVGLAERFGFAEYVPDAGTAALVRVVVDVLYGLLSEPLVVAAAIAAIRKVTRGRDRPLFSLDWLPGRGTEPAGGFLYFEDEDDGSDGAPDYDSA